MTEFFYRRIQKTGGSTYVVSLPKHWVEARLKKGDAVQITVHGDNLIVSSEQRGKERSRAAIDFDGDVEKTVREIITHYLDGTDYFAVRAPKKSHAAIKQYAKEKVPGLETVEETEGGLVLQNLLSQTNISFHAALRRMHFLNQTLLEKILLKIRRRDDEDLTAIESEVDRFFILAFRKMSHIRQADPKIHEHAVYYVIVVKSLEKIADHAYIFSKEISPSIGRARRRVLVRQCLIVAAAYNDVMEALLREDAAAAEKALTSMRRERKEFDSRDFLSYNLLRILDYSADVAEMTLDIFSKKR